MGGSQDGRHRRAGADHLSGSRGRKGGHQRLRANHRLGAAPRHHRVEGFGAQCPVRGLEPLCHLPLWRLVGLTRLSHRPSGRCVPERRFLLRGLQPGGGHEGGAPENRPQLSLGRRPQGAHRELGKHPLSVVCPG